MKIKEIVVDKDTIEYKEDIVKQIIGKKISPLEGLTQIIDRLVYHLSATGYSAAEEFSQGKANDFKKIRDLIKSDGNDGKEIYQKLQATYKGNQYKTDVMVSLLKFIANADKIKW